MDKKLVGRAHLSLRVDICNVFKIRRLKPFVRGIREDIRFKYFSDFLRATYIFIDLFKAMQMGEKKKKQKPKKFSQSRPRSQYHYLYLNPVLLASSTHICGTTSRGWRLEIREMNSLATSFVSRISPTCSTKVPVRRLCFSPSTTRLAFWKFSPNHMTIALPRRIVCMAVRNYFNLSSLFLSPREEKKWKDYCNK